jgi:hypothetical protein
MQSNDAPTPLLVLRRVVVRRGVFAGLGLALASTAIGGIAFASGNAAMGYAAVTLGFGMAMGWGVTWAIYVFTVARPLARLTKATVALAETDTAALSDALAAMAEGDLTRKLEMKVTPIAISASWRLPMSFGPSTPRSRGSSLRRERHSTSQSEVRPSRPSPATDGTQSQQ